MSGIRTQGAGTLLTGASSGIGRATALELAARGARLAVVARRADRLEALADEVAAAGRPRPAVIVADLAQPGVAHEVAAQAQTTLGVVDIVVNNAGGGVGGSQFAVGDSMPGREAFEVNYWAPLALIHDLVPAMRERRHGAVVNVTSLAQVAAWPGFGAYAATKAALALATQTLHTELHNSGVHVTEVIPGPVDTAVQAETRLLPGIERMLDATPLGSPRELARLVADAIEHGRPRVIYPRRSRVAYTFPALARWYSKRLAVRSLAALDEPTREAILTMVIRSGSMGDAVAREARAQWERAHAPG
jgi:short-subunit dehydrogenase